MTHRLPFLLLLALALGACASSAAGPSPTQSATSSVQRAAGVLPPIAGAYAALGASETYGSGAQPHTAGYAYLVARRLHARKFVDLGIPGTTLDAGYQSELTGALAIRPQLCTVFFGFNDARAGVTRNAFLADLNDVVVTLQRARCRVLVIGLPDLSLLSAVKASGVGGIHATVVSWNRGMQAIARRHGARFLNLDAFSRELAHHPEYISADGLHPSNVGHRRLAAVVVDAIHRFKLFGGAS
jgi:lysophospholipase L1-like esterase